MPFKLQDQKYIPFLEGVLYRYTHTEKHCEVMHVHNKDVENVFVFAVPTIPNDDTGVAHILEHSVLSGSERYRVKSPFFLLEQGSCRTYLNAATYPDRTLYLGASLLSKDLFNLMSMSGDAVWFPLLKEDRFRQEGFHYRFDEQGNPYAAGVVFNEMKGFYSDKIAIIDQEIQQRLFSDMAYRFDSGGVPHAIPTLKYEDFVAFYKRWYRPENTKILLYGNIDTEEYLSFIEKELLSRWKSPPLPKPSGIGFQAHKRLREYDDNGKERIHLVSVPQMQKSVQKEDGSIDITWMLGDSMDIINNGLLRIIHFVLLEIPGAPLRKKLIDSNVVDDISALSGPSAYLRQSFYTIGCTGLEKKHYEKIRDLIFRGLEDIVRDGIADDIVQAAISRIEFSFRNRLNSTGGKVGWLSSLAKSWLYGGDVTTFADVDSALEQVKAKLATPRVLESFIQEYFIENEHRVIVAADPDKEYEQDHKTQEQKILDEVYGGQDEGSYWKRMIEDINTLHSEPEREEDVASIPTLQKSDLPKKVETITYEQFSVEKETVVQWVPHVDNGLMHIVLRFDISDLMKDEETRLLLPTLTASLTDLGIEGTPYHEMSIRTCLTTGRLGANANNYIHVDGSSRVFLNVWMGVLEEKLVPALELVRELLLKTDFTNHHRLKEIVNEGKSLMRANLVDAGSTLAITHAAQNYSFNAFMDNEWNGLKQLRWASDFSRMEHISQKFIEVRKDIFVQERLSVSVVGASRLQSSTNALLNSFIKDLPSAQYVNDLMFPKEMPWIKDDFGVRVNMSHLAMRTQLKKQAIFMPIQVSFNALVFPAVSYDHPLFAHHVLTSRIISAKLLEKIRMGYGAYGASAAVLGDESLFVCYTYRDPNISKTFDIFAQCIEEVAKGMFTERELDSHIVGAVGNSLVQMSPQGKAKILFERTIVGISDEFRQFIRDGFLASQKSHIITIAQEYMQLVGDASIASVCNKDMAKELQWDHTEEAPY